jgi:glyoxylase-like metal-dependent hydrolase (beta-lactamase superfamily II)/rhodanese-related sulfurtransferase
LQIEETSMFFKQFFLGCLAQASYLIGDQGEAAVVDPRRDVEVYLEEAKTAGLSIRWVIETHFHADFVSGHRELAARSGATIVYGRRAGAAFPFLAVGDGDELSVGRLGLRILETPGHTPESICVVIVESAIPRKVLTGDTLFIGDVGRPDLVGSQGFTPQDMAGMLYDSIHDKLLRLPDEVEVWPGHGAGSACGRNISTDTSSTIGAQRAFNHALAAMAKEAFVAMMTADLPEAPRYFSDDARLNRSGPRRLDELAAPPRLNALPSDAERLDVRDAGAFGARHVPASLNLGLEGQFAPWAGSLIGLERPVVVIADDETHAGEAITRLSRVGIDNVVGWMDLETWAGPWASIPQMTVRELAEHGGLQIVDVRRPAEYAAGHVEGAVPHPLASLERELDQLDPSRPTAVICRSGYRSSAAASILARHGFRDVRNVSGGMIAWNEAELASV